MRRSTIIKWLCTTGVALVATAGAAQPALPLVDAAVGGVTAKVTTWRRDIHQHPELGNHEKRTGALVAEHLRKLGLDEVRTGIAHTGVVGILRGKKPGGVIALRADMDALPIKEATGLPFASTVTVDVDGKPTPVMHACGHDAHTAMLMGAAEVLAGMRDRIAGTVVFVFQPAEEGGPPGQVSGARLMLKEGAFKGVKPDAIFGLHVEPGTAGQIQVRPGPLLSSASDILIDLTGRQTHGGRPWEGTDLVNLSADIVKSLATIASRQVNVFEFPNVVSIGSLQAGNRMNILPGTATLRGTIRTFDLTRRDRLKALIRTSVDGLAKTYGAEAKVNFEDVALVTGSDPKLLDTILPALRSAATAGVDTNTLLRGAAEDFSFFEAEIPGVYYILGSTPAGAPKDAVPTNHSDKFDIDERVLPVGVKAHVLSALAFLDSRAAK
ncbi:amidohydrolase [Sphingoaurantiacus capsulatus]|uniref:Amidohydrolase n=1 Tax=Sphingoaurantiacus capsulatus TaxID=1771310 RepID=A0ABV7XAM9_9SPHN